MSAPLTPDEVRAKRACLERDIVEHRKAIDADEAALWGLRDRICQHSRTRIDEDRDRRFVFCEDCGKNTSPSEPRWHCHERVGGCSRQNMCDYQKTCDDCGQTRDRPMKPSPADSLRTTPDLIDTMPKEVDTL